MCVCVHRGTRTWTFSRPYLIARPSSHVPFDPYSRSLCPTDTRNFTKCPELVSQSTTRATPLYSHLKCLPQASLTSCFPTTLDSLTHSLSLSLTISLFLFQRLSIYLPYSNLHSCQSLFLLSFSSTFSNFLLFISSNFSLFFAYAERYYRSKTLFPLSY